MTYLNKSSIIAVNKMCCIFRICLFLAAVDDRCPWQDGQSLLHKTWARKTHRFLLTELPFIQNVRLGNLRIFTLDLIYITVIIDQMSLATRVEVITFAAFCECPRKRADSRAKEYWRAQISLTISEIGSETYDPPFQLSNGEFPDGRFSRNTITTELRLLPFACALSTDSFQLSQPTRF